MLFSHCKIVDSRIKVFSSHAVYNIFRSFLFTMQALDFVLRSEYVVDTTLVGTVMNGLSQIKGAGSRQEFICGLIRGIGE